MTNILVTGITGLVGSSFVARLLKLDKDLKVTAVVRRQAKKNAAKRVLETIDEQYNFDNDSSYAAHSLERIKVLEGDITNPELLKNEKDFEGVDTVFHCAADVNLGKDPLKKTYNINFNGTKYVLDLAKRLNVDSIHYVSTAYVAGKTKGRVPEDGLIATDFNNSYEKSKFDAEKLIRNSGIPFSIYRPAIVVGRKTDGKIRKPLAFYRILEFMAKLKKHHCSKALMDPADWFEMPLRLQAYPSETVYFVPIDYVQYAISEIFMKQPVSGKTYHITGDSPVATKDIENVIRDVLKLKGVNVMEKIENPSMDEKLVHRFIGDLLPYFSSRSIFDQTNVRAALGDEALSWKIEMEKLRLLISAFYKYSFPNIGWLQKL
jgi:nucleoside-diphosphate-sugar epimerase